MDKRVRTMAWLSVGLLTSVGLWWLLRAPRPPVEEQAAPPEIVPEHPEGRATNRTQLEPAPAHPEQAPDAASPRQLAVEGLVTANGRRGIRCSVRGALQDGPVATLERAWIEDGVLSALVFGPEGEQVLYSHNDPHVRDVVVSWAGAVEGQVTGCAVEARDQVDVVGTLEEDGAPARGHRIRCVQGRSQDVTTGPDGFFRCQAIAGTPLTVNFVDAQPDQPGPIQLVVGTDGNDLGVLSVVRRAKEADVVGPDAQELAQQDEHLVRAVEAFQSPEHPVRVALRTHTDAPDDVRALWQSWLEDEAAMLDAAGATVDAMWDKHDAQLDGE